MPRGYPGSTLGVDPRSQGVIPRRFKRKKIFVTDGQTPDEHWKKDGQTDVIVEIVIYSETRKYPHGQQNFDGFCQFEPKPLVLQKICINID